jgi:hypothetical protein
LLFSFKHTHSFPKTANDETEQAKDLTSDSRCYRVCFG